MGKIKTGEPGATKYHADISTMFSSFSSFALLLSLLYCNFFRLSNFAFTDRGSQTPLPYVREAEVELDLSNWYNNNLCLTRSCILLVLLLVLLKVSEVDVVFLFATFYVFSSSQNWFFLFRILIHMSLISCFCRYVSTPLLLFNFWSLNFLKHSLVHINYLIQFNSSKNNLNYMTECSYIPS